MILRRRVVYPKAPSSAYCCFHRVMISVKKDSIPLLDRWRSDLLCLVHLRYIVSYPSKIKCWMSQLLQCLVFYSVDLIYRAGFVLSRFSNENHLVTLKRNIFYYNKAGFPVRRILICTKNESRLFVFFWYLCSEGHQKKAPGNKLSTATPLPGKNGNPTFAAVAAGYDKSPGKYVTIKTWSKCVHCSYDDLFTRGH